MIPPDKAIAPPAPVVDDLAPPPLDRAEMAFAARFYPSVCAGDQNVAFSPASLRIAFAMAYAGACDETADEMARVFGFEGDATLLHAASAALRGWDAPGEAGREPRVRVANRLWGQRGLAFQPHFVRLLTTRYGAPPGELDFAGDPEASRVAANAWIARETGGAIRELLAPGDVSTLTRLVLANAVRLDALWRHPFDASLTHMGEFTKASGERVRAPFLRGTPAGRYGEVGSTKVLELSYEGDLSMIIALPNKPKRIAQLGAELNTGSIAAWLEALREADEIEVSLPRFRVNSALDLSAPLAALGLRAAFSPDHADFSGIDGTLDLYLNIVRHAVCLDVDEGGTRAAASTVAGIDFLCAPPPRPQFFATHPFLFALLDRAQGRVLFFGRLSDPL